MVFYNFVKCNKFVKDWRLGIFNFKCLRNEILLHMAFFNYYIGKKLDRTVVIFKMEKFLIDSEFYKILSGISYRKADFYIQINALNYAI